MKNYNALTNYVIHSQLESQNKDETGRQGKSDLFHNTVGELKLFFGSSSFHYYFWNFKLCLDHFGMYF